jgi:hypothetical protein
MFDVGYCLDYGFLSYDTVNGKSICSVTLKVEAASFPKRRNKFIILKGITFLKTIPWNPTLQKGLWVSQLYCLNDSYYFPADRPPSLT